MVTDAFPSLTVKLNTAAGAAEGEELSLGEMLSLGDSLAESLGEADGVAIGAPE